MDFLSHLSKYLNQEEIDKLNASLKHKSEHALLLNLKKMNCHDPAGTNP